MVSQEPTELMVTESHYVQKLSFLMDELLAALLASNDIIVLVQPFLIAVAYDPLDAGSSGRSGRSGVNDEEDVVYS